MVLRWWTVATVGMALGEPLLVLDVDGVISPVGRSNAWNDLRMVEDAPYWLLISRSMGDALADLPAERVWLTSWDHLANEWVAPALGWSPLPVVEWPDGPRARPNHLKLEGLEAFLDPSPDPPERLVWCEDTLADPGLEGAAREALSDIHHLLLAPDPAVGLTPEDIHGIERFLRSGTGTG